MGSFILTTGKPRVGDRLRDKREEKGDNSLPVGVR